MIDRIENRMDMSLKKKKKKRNEKCRLMAARKLKSVQNIGEISLYMAILSMVSVRSVQCVNKNARL